MCKLGASASLGRAGCSGNSTGHAQVMLQGAGPVGCCHKVVRGRFVTGSWEPWGP